MIDGHEFRRDDINRYVCFWVYVEGASLLVNLQKSRFSNTLITTGGRLSG